MSTKAKIIVLMSVLALLFAAMACQAPVDPVEVFGTPTIQTGIEY